MCHQYNSCASVPLAKSQTMHTTYSRKCKHAYSFQGFINRINSTKNEKNHKITNTQENTICLTQQEQI